MVDYTKVRASVAAQRKKMAVWMAAALLIQFLTWRAVAEHYLEFGSRWLVFGTAAAAIVLICAIYSLAHQVIRKIAVESQSKWERSYREVVRIATRLCNARGIPVPTIGLWKGAFFEGSLKEVLSKASGADGRQQKLLQKLLPLNAGMVDRPFSRDVMLVGEKLPEILTEAELEAVLAHELRHSDQLENLASYLPAFAQIAIGLLFLVGGLHYAFAAGFFREATWIMLFAGATLLRVNRAFVRTALAGFSRARELETDAEASQDIEDPEALISALEKISKAMQEACPDLPSAPPHLRSHPTVADRAEALRALI